nr:hypothetical protein [Tanacetum cinerariifolium]
GVTKESVMNNAEKPFIVVQNKKLNYEKENKNSSRWNGYNGINANKRDNENCLENKIGEENKKDAGSSTYNRFSLLDELIGEDELIPPIE